MDTFIEKTLEPAVFWSALGAIGTLLAVCVALFFPLISKHFKLKKIRTLLALEIKDNHEQISKMKPADFTSKLPNGQEVPASALNCAYAENVKLRIWDEYRYKIASEKPLLFKQYREIYSHIETIANFKDMPEQLRGVAIIECSEEFKKQYNIALQNKLIKHA